MSTIDIRKEADTAVDKIVYGSSEEAISQDVEGMIILVDGDMQEDAYVRVSDISNLIKALQKAQELWGKK